MKKINVILFFGNQSCKAQKVETIKIQTSAICDLCKERIEGALAYEKGVKSSDLDLETKIVSIKIKPDKTNVETLRKFLSELGYDADEVLANPEAYNKLPACCQKGGHD